jgi:hypothetical protein
MVSQSFRALFAAGLLFLSPIAFSAGAHHHHIAAFVGATSHHHETAPTFGLDYEYRLPVANNMFGAVALIDAAFFDHQTLVSGIGIAMHPVGGFKVLLAAGHESSDGHGAPLVRTGLAYDLHFGSFSFAPTYNADLIKGNTPAHVVGMSIGYGF